MELAKLKAFRQAVYNRLGAARDATFELTDAVLLTRNAYSLADLSLSPVFRRKWPSIYEALQDSRPQRNKLMKLYIEQMPSSERPLIAVDHTCWQRPEAVTLQERTIEHQCTAVPGNRPKVCRHLAVRPIALCDCEYGCAPFVLKTADIPADKLVRLRSNLCLWGAPPPYSGKGRPRIHGNKFQLNDPQTWGEALESLQVDDPKLGQVQIRLWRGLHFRKAANHPMLVLRVERLEPQSSGRVSKPLWLAWLGEELPPLSDVWRFYLRRFALDHWYRFAKQRLHWTLPKLSTPKQCERSSDLMPLITWELWLAREIVSDNPLPWHNKSDKLAPGRVAQAFAGVLLAIDTPASPPKPRGKSSGWPKGKPRASRPHYPIVKKGFRKGKKRRQKSV